MDLVLVRIPKAIELQIRDSLLPWLLVVIKLSLLAFSAAILATLSLFQLSGYWGTAKPVIIPVFLSLIEVNEAKAYGEPSFRQSSLLQANFSLWDKNGQFPIMHPVSEYEVQLVMELPDSDVNRSEGMFMICIQLFDRAGKVSWPTSFEWDAQLPHPKYGQCRPYVFVTTSLLKTLVQSAFSLPSLLWDPWEWKDTRTMVAILEDKYQVTRATNMPYSGSLTILSYNLQVVSSTLKFMPILTFIDRHPFVSWFFVWCFLYGLWLVVLTLTAVLYNI